MQYTVENTHYISMSKRWEKRNFFDDNLRLGLEHPIVQKADVDYTSTPCNYGGIRYWFICQKCGNKKLDLYLERKKFICRKCAGLIYNKQTLRSFQRLIEYGVANAYHYKFMGTSIRRPYYRGELTKRARMVLRRLEQSARYLNLMEDHTYRVNKKIERYFGRNYV
jgi:hypothetical protein